MEKITLKNVKVIFYNPEDGGWGRSITIDATDKKVQEQISKWVKANNIGKGPLAGKANFKEYTPEDGGETITQFTFKLNDRSFKNIVGVGKLGASDLGYGSEVSLTAQAFNYDNQWGKGTSQSVSAIVVHSAGGGASEDLNELVADLGVDLAEGEPVDLAEVPFD